MSLRRRAGALAVTAMLTFATLGRAGPKRVAIADASLDAAAGLRLRAELATAGFAIVDVAAWDDDASPEQVARALHAAKVSAAVRVGDEAADVWVIDPRTRAAVLREVIRADAESSPGDETIALRAVEIVRAELLVKKTTPPPAPRAKVRPPAPVAGPAPGAAPLGARTLALDLGVGVSASPGGTTVSPAVVLGATWLPSDHVGLGTLVMASPIPSAIEGPEGDAHVWTGMVGLSAALLPTSAASSWVVRLDPGLAVCWLHVVGEAEAPYADGEDTIAAPAAYMKLGLEWRFASALSLLASATAASTFSRPVIGFAGREAATWGRPLILGSIQAVVSP